MSKRSSPSRADHGTLSEVTLPSYAAAMPATIVATVLRLLVASFAVGLLLSWFDWTPQQVWLWGRDLAAAVLTSVQGWIGSTLTYVLLGAVIVVPLWLLRLAWRTVRTRL